jgi:hypothetical protein
MQRKVFHVKYKPPYQLFARATQKHLFMASLFGWATKIHLFTPFFFAGEAK